MTYSLVVTHGYRMRIVPLALLASLAIPAVAQEPVPDTTAPWLYYPLEVGNEWEYEDYWGFGGPTRYYRRAIVSDTLIAGSTYFIEAHSDGWGNGWRFLRVEFVRYDSATTRLTEWRDNGDLPRSCQLDAAFWSWTDCNAGTGPGGSPEETMVRGGYADTLRFWRTEEEMVVPVKRFDVYSDESEIYAATIGYAGAERCCMDGFVRIRYARVGGLEYGAQIFVQAAPPPGRQPTALQASPNPTAGPLFLEFGLQFAGPVVLETFDALGRRVHHGEMVLGAGSHTLPVDAAQWNPGLYIVRATAGGVNVSARVVRR